MGPRSALTGEVKSANDIADTFVCGAIGVESDDAPVAAAPTVAAAAIQRGGAIAGESD